MIVSLCIGAIHKRIYRNYAIDSRTPGGCGNPPDDATPIFISESGSSILGLSNDISFVSELFLEGG